MNNQRLGFVGAGIMGRPMAMNLIRAGYQLQVFSRQPQAATPLIAEGATLAASPALAAQAADIIITMVSDTPDIEEVVLGNQGILNGAMAGSVVVDMSTISPSATRRIAATLQSRGIEMLDAPVSGGEQGAICGSLSIMVGGKHAVFEQVLPVLSCLGDSITHIGDHGAGQVAKACNQLLVAQTIAAVAEVLHLARASKVAPDKVREALLGGFAYSKILEVHGKRMLDRHFAPGFKAKLHLKDMHIALDAATELGIRLPGAELVMRHLATLVESGGGELDSAALVTLIE
jgi:2-hydroxy-3-oxopropionate reductase